MQMNLLNKCMYNPILNEMNKHIYIFIYANFSLYVITHILCYECMYKKVNFELRLIFIYFFFF